MLLKEWQLNEIPLIKDALVQKRKEKKWRQEDVANYAGISPRSYPPYETGKKIPSLPVLRKLCDVLGLPYEQLRSQVSTPTVTNVDDPYKRLGNIFKQVREKIGVSAPTLARKYRLEDHGITSDFFETVERGVAIRQNPATTPTSITLRKRTLDKIQYLLHVFNDLISHDDMEFVLDLLDAESKKLAPKTESLHIDINKLINTILS